MQIRRRLRTTSACVHVNRPSRWVWLIHVIACMQQAKGNAAFSAGKFEEAIEHFTEGIEVAPENHVLFSNRSAAKVSTQSDEVQAQLWVDGHIASGIASRMLLAGRHAC